MGNTYTEIPFGSRVETVMRGNAELGDFKLENITITYGTKIVERPDEVGSTKGTPGDATGPGWGGSELCPTMTAVLQIPTSTSKRPKPLTDWFADTFDGTGGDGEETYVFTEVGQAFAMDGYLKCNVSLRFAANPPAAWAGGGS